MVDLYSAGGQRPGASDSSVHQGVSFAKDLLSRHMDQITLSALAAFPQQIEALYAVFPMSYTHWAPPSWDGIPSERFTAIEQVDRKSVV